MYAFQLPPAIPPAGTPGGPPVPDSYRKFANAPFPGDIRLMWINSIRDPQQLQPTWDRMVQMGEEMQKQKRSAKPKR